MKYPRVTSAVLCVLFFSVACAATGNLEQYPRQAIDRPYTLPKGIATWEPFWHYESLKHNGETTTDAWFNGLVWTQSLSDSLNITWFPLPLLLSYQIGRTDRAVYGTSIGFTSIGYSTIDKWTFGMAAAVQQKYKFNDWLALVTRLSFDEVVRTKTDRSDSWGVDLAMGPLFQVSDDIAVLPQIHYAVERNFPSIFDRPEVLDNKTYVILPLSIAVIQNLDRQWDLQARYQHTSIGYPKNTREDDLTIAMIHYW